MSTEIIGIDFGTTTSRVAIYRNNRVEVITNDRDSRETPSYVYRANGETLVGEDAKNNALHDPENTIYDIKRVIGSSFDQTDLVNEDWLFSVVPDKHNLAKIEMKFDERNHLFDPETIVTKILSKLKQAAERFLEKKVTEAVITVPSFFNIRQREAVIKAGKDAGLLNIYLLNESVAAAIAYAQRKKHVTGNTLVFSFGSGPLDISIVSLRGKSLLVKCSSENSYIRGEEFTKKLMEHFAVSFQRKHNENLLTNKQALWRLREECESLKMKLSFSPKIKFHVHAIMNGIDINEIVTRQTFNKLNAKNFFRIRVAVNKILESVKMSYTDIDKVVMVGGSSRIPQIQGLLKEMFTKEKIYILPNPDETALSGVALYKHLPINSKITVFDILPRPLYYCFDNNIGNLVPIQPRNTLISNELTSSNVKTIEIPRGIQLLSTYEGYEAKCLHLSDFYIDDTTNKARFKLDENRILQLTLVRKRNTNMIKTLPK